MENVWFTENLPRVRKLHKEKYLLILCVNIRCPKTFSYMLGSLAHLKLLWYNYSIEKYMELCRVKMLAVQTISRKD